MHSSPILTATAVCLITILSPATVPAADTEPRMLIRDPDPFDRDRTEICRIQATPIKDATFLVFIHDSREKVEYGYFRKSDVLRSTLGAYITNALTKAGAGEIRILDHAELKGVSVDRYPETVWQHFQASGLECLLTIRVDELVLQKGGIGTLDIYYKQYSYSKKGLFSKTCGRIEARVTAPDCETTPFSALRSS